MDVALDQNKAHLIRYAIRVSDAFEYQNDLPLYYRHIVDPVLHTRKDMWVSKIEQNAEGRYVLYLKNGYVFSVTGDSVLYTNMSGDKLVRDDREN